MTNEQTLIKAAERVNDRFETFSCTSISNITDSRCGIRDWYARMFAPEGFCFITTTDVSDAVEETDASISFRESSKQRELRVLLLCMASACVTDLYKED